MGWFFQEILGNFREKVASGCYTSYQTQLQSEARSGLHTFQLWFEGALPQQDLHFVDFSAIVRHASDECATFPPLAKNNIMLCPLAFQGSSCTSVSHAACSLAASAWEGSEWRAGRPRQRYPGSLWPLHLHHHHPRRAHL